MKNILNEQLLQKEMTRKQFLQYVLGVVAAIIGLNNLISALNLSSTQTTLTPQKNDDQTAKTGFGTRKFGV